MDEMLHLVQSRQASSGVLIIILLDTTGPLLLQAFLCLVNS